jgi:hypothetical protein
MTDLVKVKLHISPAQFKKLTVRKQTQFKHHELDDGPHFLLLHPHKAKKVHHAKRHKKGVRLHLSDEELHHTIEGGGFGDFINKLKNAGQWLKSNIIDSSFYQSAIKPIARQLVNQGLSAAAPRLGAAAPIAQQAVDAIGSKTNAFGMRKHHKGAHHQSAFSEFAAASASMPSPFQNPGAFTAYPQPSTGDGMSSHHHYHHYYYPHRGGSFKLA